MKKYTSNVLYEMSDSFVLTVIFILFTAYRTFKQQKQTQSALETRTLSFQVAKSIDNGIRNTGLVITSYRIYTIICSIAQHQFMDVLNEDIQGGEIRAVETLLLSGDTYRKQLKEKDTVICTQLNLLVFILFISLKNNNDK